jgi:hypothetical protein
VSLHYENPTQRVVLEHSGPHHYTTKETFYVLATILIV